MSDTSVSLERLSELIGLPTALRLIKRFGGTRIYLPHPSRVKPNNAVALEIGEEALRTLAGAWRQEYVKLPRGAPYLRTQRDAALVEDAKTLSILKLALKYQMSMRNVQLRLALWRAKTRTQELNVLPGRRPVRDGARRRG